MALAETIAAHRWSPVDQGVRGRLRALRAEGGAAIRVVLDLENVGPSPRSVPDCAPLALTWRLTSDEGAVETRLGRSEIFSSAEWKTLAPGERVTLEVSREPDDRGAELDLITHIWSTLPRGRLHLSASYHVDSRRETTPPECARTLTLALPSCLLPEGATAREDAPDQPRDPCLRP